MKGRSHIEWRGARIFLDVLEELAEILVHIQQRALATPAETQGEQDRLIFAVELVDVADLLRDSPDIVTPTAELFPDLPLPAPRGPEAMPSAEELIASGEGRVLALVAERRAKYPEA